MSNTTYQSVRPGERFKVRPFEPVINELPGRNRLVIDVSSRTQAQLDPVFNNIAQGYDTVILTDVDTWIWHDMDAWVVNHPGLKNRRVFILELGYSTQQLGPLTWRVGYPYWYFYRTLPPRCEFTPKPPNLKYGYGCLNNRPAPHRLWLGTELNQRGLLDQIIYTQNNYARMSEAQDTPPPCGTVPAVDTNIPAYEALTQVSGWAEFQAQLPICWDNQPITNQHTVHHPAELEAYCNITTEGMIEDLVWDDSAQCLQSIDLPQFSEKSWRPWAAGQVPVFLACRGHLAYISRLGFEPMLDLLPNGYDTMPLTTKIMTIVDLVAQGREHIEDYYYAHLRELRHNYDLVFSNTVEQTVLKQIKDQINE